MQKALSLSEEERGDLACSLIDSLDATVDDDAERRERSLLAIGKINGRRLMYRDSLQRKGA